VRAGEFSASLPRCLAVASCKARADGLWKCIGEKIDRSTSLNMKLVRDRGIRGCSGREREGAGVSGRERAGGGDSAARVRQEYGKSNGGGGHV